MNLQSYEVMTFLFIIKAELKAAERKGREEGMLESKIEVAKQLLQKRMVTVPIYCHHLLLF